MQGDIIAVRNHPTSSMPSAEDYIACCQNEYKYGVVDCHDGEVYRYETIRELTEADNERLKQNIKRWRQAKVSNREIKERLEESYGIKWETL